MGLWKHKISVDFGLIILMFFDYVYIFIGCMKKTELRQLIKECIKEIKYEKKNKLLKDLQYCHDKLLKIVNSNEIN